MMRKNIIEISTLLALFVSPACGSQTPGSVSKLESIHQAGSLLSAEEHCEAKSSDGCMWQCTVDFGCNCTEPFVNPAQSECAVEGQDLPPALLPEQACEAKSSDGCMWHCTVDFGCNCTEPFVNPSETDCAVAGQDWPSASADKEEREIHPGVVGQQSSENFVLKWGSSVSLSLAEAATILDLFETVWSVEIEQMGFPPPEGAEDTLFNVYLGNSGPGLPEIAPLLGGYFAYDAAGWPMVVLSLDAVSENVVAHEFFHALQAATSRFNLSPKSAWYIEASANWAAMQVYPNNVIPPGSYTFLPHLSLHHYDFPDEGTLEEAHHYGAYLFLHYLSSTAVGTEIIRQSWLDTGAEEDPLVVLEDLLSAQGFAMDAVFLDFAAHNATWDYPEEMQLRQGVDWLEQQLPGQNMHIAATHGPMALGSWSTVPSDLQPQDFGYNIVKFEGLDNGDYRLTLEILGNDNTIQAAAQAIIVRKKSSERSYQKLPVIENGGKIDLLGVSSGEDVFLVISAQIDGPAGSTLSYRYLLDADTQDADTQEEEDQAPTITDRDSQGNGCNGSGSPAALPALFAIFALVLRRWRPRK